MRHVSLYRKWRPRTFGAVAGQEPVVRTLERAIATGRVAHAYLFSGPRGTGKTSTAKVLAMGLNCQGSDGPTAEPDGTCESCRAIVNNSSMDVLEMDAASNRGIDEIRDLRDKVNLAPTQGRMKVYIIDEVHMLTTEAFNALLKMLEEPPEHVVFVLATTEKHKVPPTIISRCQSFDFRRPSVTLLSEKLGEIADAEGIEAEPEALTVMAREARGSFRDAEGLLDQLSSYADGPITAAKVRELLGSVASDTLLETTDALYERRAAGALRILDRLSNEGKDLSRFVAELVAHLRRLMLLPDAPKVALAEVGADERGGLEEQASRVPTAEVVRMIGALGDALSRARRGGDPKLEIELTFLKLARDYEEPQVDSLLRRLEALERAVADGAANGATIPSARSERGDSTPAEMLDVGAPEEVDESEASGGRADEEALLAGDEAGASAPVSGEVVVPTSDAGAPGAAFDWGSIVQELKVRLPAIAAVYEEARVEGFEDGVLRLAFPRELAIYAKLAGEQKRLGQLREVLEERLGTAPRLEFRVAGDGEPPADAGTDAGPNGDSSLDRARPAGPEGAPVPERGVSRSVEAVGSEPGLPPVENAVGTGVGQMAGDGSVEEKPGAAGGRIQDQSEVFDMARRLFGPDEATGGDRNGGN